MKNAEFPICFSCKGSPLIGIVHPTETRAKLGVIVVVGGPQYRVGSHRQFVLLARSLASAGIPTLRFDVRGMGDSGGIFPGFEAIDEDIGAAVNAFTASVPGLTHVVLWGLCDAASANLFYAHSDPRVAGLVLLNPWVRTAASYARAEMKHYYVDKIMNKDFWRRLVTREVRIGDAIASFLQCSRIALRRHNNSAAIAATGRAAVDPTAPLPDRMAQCLAAFNGRVLLIISGKDLTAREFDDVARVTPLWNEQLSQDRVVRKDLPAADHTFSRSDWINFVNDWTIQWLAEITERCGPPDREPAATNV